MIESSYVVNRSEPKTLGGKKMLLLHKWNVNQTNGIRTESKSAHQSASFLLCRLLTPLLQQESRWLKPVATRSLPPPIFLSVIAAPVWQPTTLARAPILIWPVPGLPIIGRLRIVILCVVIAPLLAVAISVVCASQAPIPLIPIPVVLLFIIIVASP